MSADEIQNFSLSEEIEGQKKEIFRLLDMGEGQLEKD